MNSITARLLLIVSMSLVCASPGFAGEDQAVRNSKFPAYYPDSFQKQGRFEQLDIGDGRLIISATEYGYDHNVQVHSLNTEHSSLAALKAGTPIGFRLQKHGNKEKVSEIWVLPPDALVEH